MACVVHAKTEAAFAQVLKTLELKKYCFVSNACRVETALQCYIDIQSMQWFLKTQKPFHLGKCALHAIKSSQHGLLKLIAKFVNQGNLLSRGHCYVEVLQARDQAFR